MIICQIHTGLGHAIGQHMHLKKNHLWVPVLYYWLNPLQSLLPPACISTYIFCSPHSFCCKLVPAIQNVMKFIDVNKYLLIILVIFFLTIFYFFTWWCWYVHAPKCQPCLRVLFHSLAEHLREPKKCTFQLCMTCEFFTYNMRFLRHFLWIFARYWFNSLHVLLEIWNVFSNHLSS